MGNGGARRGLRAILAAILACAAVVLLPYEAWSLSMPSGWTYALRSDYPNIPTTFTVTGTTTTSGRLTGATYTTTSGNVAFYCVSDAYSGAIPNAAQLGFLHWANYYPSYTAPSGFSKTNATQWTGTSANGEQRCSAGSHIIGGFASDVNGMFEFSTEVPTASTCPTSFTNARASYVGGVLKVRFTWKTTRPANGWDVWVPGSASAPSGSPQARALPAVIAGPGEYGSDTTVTLSGVTSGTTGFRIDVRGDSGCYVTGTTSASDVISGAVDNGDLGDGDCGLNPFCYIKAALTWAFVPSTDVGATWSAQVEAIAEEPPVNFISAGTDVLGGVLTDSGCGTTTSGMGWDGGCGAGFSSGDTAFEAADGQWFDPLAQAGAVMHDDDGPGPLIWGLMNLAIWVPVLLYMWRRVSSSFGGRS